ncbi:IMPACT family protein [Aquiflexum lacus]|uniref:IMPACT family protein n=1 Tax=Aquiflexum lacus TaxID=2483805 RepID=UPI001894301C|nr:YigZ family protein [Aquiflexum lacus]
METEDTYLTLLNDSEGLYKEKGSKFLSFAFPVSHEDEVKEKLEFLRKKYYNARHHCYAYVIGKDKEIFRANDDGEPNHSAGDPILGQIRSNQLTNVLIVVVRYFGGVKLGVGGLISAYRTATAEAISNNVIMEAIVKNRVNLQFDYLSMNDVMKIIKDYNLEIINQQFDNDCKITLLVRKGLLNEIISKLENLEGAEITID